jgi:nitrogenase molybdenum-iron protein NifN
VQPAAVTEPRRINVLAGCHLTAADIEELRELIEAFDLEPIILPDVSGSLDGHIPETFLPTTLGGTRLADIRAMGASAHTLVLGEHLREAGSALQEIAGVPFTVLPQVTGLAAVDALVSELMRLSARPVPARIRRQRSQLQDVMLDAHFHTGGKRIAIAAEPELLASTAHLLAGMGATIEVAVAATESPLLAQLPCAEVVIGDLDDFETRARAARCDLLITHSHGRQAAARTGIPLLRLGIPQFDRIGNAHRLTAGYRGTRNLLIEVANLFLDHVPHYTPADWPLPEASVRAAAAGCAGGRACAEATARCSPPAQPEGVPA